MSDIKKANEDMLHALHYAVAEKIAKLLKQAEKDPELMLKVIKEARGFLKDNEVTCDIEHTPVVREIQGVIKVAELPFKVEAE